MPEVQFYTQRIADQREIEYIENVLLLPSDTVHTIGPQLYSVGSIIHTYHKGSYLDLGDDSS